MVIEPSTELAASRFKPEYGGIRLPRKAGNLIPDYKLSQTRRLSYSL